MDTLFKSIYKEKECALCRREAGYYKVKGRRCYECGHCGNQVYPTVGTPMHGSRTPLRKWFKMLRMMTNDKGGVSACHLMRELGVTYKTAWRMRRQVAFCLAEEPKRKLTGTIEADETYVGGRRKAKGVRKVGYNGRENKTIVFGMFERGGAVRAKVVAGTGGEELLPLVAKHVEPGATVYTDEHAPYKLLPSMGYTHDFVTHKKYKFQKGKVTTNRIESFWSYIKKIIRGCHVHVSSALLWSYLAELLFLYNNRSLGPRQLFDAMLAKFIQGLPLWLL